MTAALQLVEPKARPWPDGRLNGMFDCKPPALQWSIKDRLPKGRAALLAGSGGVSKTTLLYQLASGMVLGTLPWGWEVQTVGPAVLFLTEDTIADVHRRMHLIGRDCTEEQRRKLSHCLRVYPLAGMSARLLRLSGASLQRTEVFDWMMSELDRLPDKPTFIGFDPAIGVSEGDELSPAHARTLGETADEVAISTGAAVVLTTHAAKGINSVEELGSHSARGSGALTDAVRAEFALRTMTADEARKFNIVDKVERQRYVQLAVTKGNFLPPEAYAPVWLKRGDGGLLSGVTLEQVENGSVGARELQALEILREAAENGEVPMKFWRQQCVAANVIASSAGPAAQEKSAERLRDALRAAGLVKPGTSRGFWVPA